MAAARNLRESASQICVERPKYGPKVPRRKKANQADRDNGTEPIADELKLVFSSLHWAGLYTRSLTHQQSEALGPYVAESKPLAAKVQRIERCVTTDFRA